MLIHMTYLYMATIAIAEVSKVKSQGIWPYSPLHYKAEVCLMSAPRPAHVLVMVEELFSLQKHTDTKRENVPF